MTRHHVVLDGAIAVGAVAGAVLVFQIWWIGAALLWVAFLRVALGRSR